MKGKPRKRLTKVQTELLKTHSKHHAQGHIAEMKTQMRAGYCFQDAHARAPKKLGK